MLNGTDSNLELLVKELLLARTEGLGPTELAAFIDGWSSLLQLLGRTDLTLPGASDRARAPVDALVRAIERAQARVLEDPSGE